MYSTIIFLGICPEKMKTMFTQTGVHEYSWQLYSQYPTTGSNSNCLKGYLNIQQKNDYINPGTSIQLNSIQQQKGTNFLLIQATTWMDHKGIMLSEKKPFLQDDILFQSIYIKFSKWSKYRNNILYKAAGGNWVWNSSIPTITNLHIGSNCKELYTHIHKWMHI